ncbi:MAG: YbaN family protein [Henriciella sp.]|jgi:uncharacterized membrane protein YbaN (DUF454 family)|nr:YbaN family protein [Henriciella sp.]
MRWLWVSCGFVLFVIGAIGIVLPLWPTTIFWIGAVFCLAESHPKVRDWIYTRPGVGPIVRDFVEHGEISRKGKIAAIIGIILTGGLSAWLLHSRITVVAILAIVLILVSVFIVTRREPNL